MERPLILPPLEGKMPPVSTTRVADSIAIARKGCLSTLGNLLDHYRRFLLKLAADEMGDDLAGKISPSDLVQETCLKAARDFGQFRGTTEPELRAWLRQALLHHVCDARRTFVLAQKRSVQREVHPDAVSEDGWERMSCTSPSPSERALSHEEFNRIESAIRQLPTDSQIVIEKRVFERLSFDEIGLSMHRSADAVRMIWARAIKRLAATLSDGDSQT